MPPNETRVRIDAVRALSPSVCSLSLTPLGLVAPGQSSASTLPAFTAGQWLHLHVETASGQSEKRAYSIASGPNVLPIELAVTHVGDGVVSPILHQLKPGTELMCDGPYGFFTRDPSLQTTPSLFVGTGTGLSPLRSMLVELLAEPNHAPVTLLFGVRSEADILWRDELESWAARDPNFKLAVTLSRPDDGWAGRAGYVQTHVPELARELGEPHVFVCGLSKMVGEVRALCKSELGMDRKRIHSERYD